MTKTQIQLNHVHIKTTKFSDMREFLTDVIGLEEVEQSEVSAEGAWFGSNGKPFMHVMEEIHRTTHVRSMTRLALEGASYNQFMNGIKEQLISFGEAIEPNKTDKHVFVHGPDGLLVEMIFTPA